MVCLVSFGVLKFYVEEIGILVFLCMCLVIGLRKVGFQGICIFGMVKLMVMLIMFMLIFLNWCIMLMELVSVCLLWLLYFSMLKCIVRVRCFGYILCMVCRVFSRKWVWFFMLLLQMLLCWLECVEKKFWFRQLWVKCSFSYLKLVLCVWMVVLMKFWCMWVMLFRFMVLGILGKFLLKVIVDGVMVFQLCVLLVVMWLLFFQG